MFALLVATLLIAAASWRFIERPFRDPERVSTRRFLAISAGSLTITIAIGLTLHLRAGFPRWTYPEMTDEGAVGIAYNERVRNYAASAFPGDGRANVLVVGDSFGRDVANVLIESTMLTGKNLAYTDRYPGCGSRPRLDTRDRALYAAASVVVIALDGHDLACAHQMEKAHRAVSRAPVVFFGSKHFGYNINPFGRVPVKRRAAVLARVPGDEIENNEALRSGLPPARYIDQLRLLGPDGNRVRFFDDDGNPIAFDRYHLTRPGAIFEAKRLAIRQPAAVRIITEAGSAAE